MIALATESLYAQDTESWSSNMSSGYVYGTPLTPEREKELIEKIAQWTVKYKMEFPTIVFLQSIKPMGRVISAMGVFYTSAYMGISPGISQYGQEAIALFDNPDSIERLMKRIEELSQEQEQMKDEVRKQVKSDNNEGFAAKLKKLLRLS